MDPLSVSSGVLTLVVSALQSSKVLHRTISSLRDNQRTVRELREELEALNGVLETLQEVVSYTDVDFALLRFPLLRCGQACKDFEAVIVEDTARPNGSQTGFRDWAKQKHMGDISDFRNRLVEYKTTFEIVLAKENM